MDEKFRGVAERGVGRLQTKAVALSACHSSAGGLDGENREAPYNRLSCSTLHAQSSRRRGRPLRSEWLGFSVPPSEATGRVVTATTADYGGKVTGVELLATAVGLTTTA